MTIAELAALAAKVEGFERPTVVHCDDGCDKCDDRTWVFDNSPAALLMAVHVCVAKRALEYNMDDARIAIDSPLGGAAMGIVANEESIARAALVALLRAHGVEADDG